MKDSIASDVAQLNEIKAVKPRASSPVTVDAWPQQRASLRSSVRHHLPALE